jgi:hypothetical protein
MASIFGDVRRDRRQLRHLVPPWVAHDIARVHGPLSVTTDVRDEIHDRVHALGGDQRSRVTGMAWLSAGLASTLPAAPPCALTPGKAIGRRGLRRRRRVLIAEGELTLQFGDPLGLLSHLPLTFGKLPAQALHLVLQPFLSVRPLLSLGPRHASYGTPIGSTCTAP